MIDNEHYRYGSAEKAALNDLYREKIINAQGAYFCHDETGQHECRNPADGSLALFGGAGSAKSAAFYAHNLIGNTMDCNGVWHDPRGELSAISSLALALNGYAQYCFNPVGLHGLPSHRTNPLDHLTIDSLSLIADNHKTMSLIQPPSQSDGGKHQWWKDDALNIFLKPINLAIIERDGQTSLPVLYREICNMEGNIDAWASLLEFMSTSRFSEVRSAAGSLMALQQSEGRPEFPTGAPNVL